MLLIALQVTSDNIQPFLDTLYNYTRVSEKTKLAIWDQLHDSFHWKLSHRISKCHLNFVLHDCVDNFTFQVIVFLFQLVLSEQLPLGLCKGCRPTQDYCVEDAACGSKVPRYLVPQNLSSISSCLFFQCRISSQFSSQFNKVVNPSKTFHSAPDNVRI